MNTKNKKPVNNFEKPFNTQKELQQNIVDRFAKHGGKVRYNFKIKIES